MGHAFYSSTDRMSRAAVSYSATKSRDDIFAQNRKGSIHTDMNPQGVVKREACDSETHPNTVPVQLYLDHTGSMGQVPEALIREGLPKLIGKLIQNGVPDVTLMFGAVGDHECDSAPLQVGQFESGDAEMDMWLERVWLEGGGGGNAGESYLLAWYFAGHHVYTDAFTKRGKKGFVFTVGDEPCLKALPISALKKIMGSTAVGESTYSLEDLLAQAQEQNHVFHIHVKHGTTTSNYVDPAWKELLGQNLIVINDYTKLDETISGIILSHVDKDTKDTKDIKVPEKVESTSKPKKESKITL